MSDPTGTDRPLWRDVSRYQMYWDHAVAVLNGVLGVFVRAGISWGYHDPFFRYLYGGAAGKMYRSTYHVLFPTQSVVKQADKVWYVQQPKIEKIPRCIDLEVFGDASDAQVADSTWEMSELVFSRDGVRPIIYSRYKLIEKGLHDWTPEMLNKHYWILAQYRFARWLEHKGPPTLPKYPNGTYMINRSNVILHQTADKKKPFPGEVPTPYAGKSIDYDRWEIGNEIEMHKWIDDTWGNGSTPPPPPPLGIKEVKVTASALNIRKESNAASKDIGTLVGGSVVPVDSEDGDWLQLHPAWIHGDYVKEE